jgi:osmoprotectant transport system permease protein
VSVSVWLALLLLAVPATAALQDQTPTHARAVLVASKPFGESYLLAEMFAQLLEARGFSVSRRPGLGATEIAFQALRSDAIDVYPEYTGTGLLAILGQRPSADPADVYRQVAREFHRRFGLRWLPPLGFQNTYAIAVRQETAQRYHLATLSDLARISGSLRAGLTADFIGRADGLPGIQKAYGIRFRAVRALLPAVKYQALAAGEVDVIDGYSTDGFIARYNLVILKDDLHFFPPYEAAALVSRAFLRDLPGGVAALTELSGLLTEQDMRRLNRRVELDGIPVARVAGGALLALGLTSASPANAVATRDQARAGLFPYLWSQRLSIVQLTLRHLLLVGVSLLGAIACALPLGLMLERRRSSAEPVIRGVGLLQTLPSIALLAFMIPLLGIGVVPAVVALFLYSLYPILRNTYTGVRDAAPDAVGAAWALGMTPRQILRHVRLPLAAPVIMAGIRTAAIINVGTATLAAFIGAGGLGDLIASGLALSDTRMILSGALPAALLALVVDAGLGLCERAVRPGG